MHKQIFPLIVISIISLFGFILLHDRLNRSYRNERRVQLQNTHNAAVIQFKRSVNHFSTLMSGMRSYLLEAQDFPSQKQLFNFLNEQLEQLDFKDSLVVSYLNTEHEFIYSFDRKSINPNGLVGMSVNEFRDQNEIDRLEALLKTNGLKVFQPINLVEGWVGIPLNFRVHRDNETTGYVASIINFKGIVSTIDKSINSEQFVIKFETSKDLGFDRERVYDGTQVYHDRIDTLSSQLVNIDDESWISTEMKLFEQNFIISTAYRQSSRKVDFFNVIFILIYLVIVGFSVIAIYKTWVSRSLYLKLEKLNAHVLDQNDELTVLNRTKDRFFSIIGHDLRGPLNNIISLMEIVDHHITHEEMTTLLAQLTPAAKSSVHLLEDLLRWAQINNDEIIFNPQEVDIEEIIDTNIELLKPNAKVKKLTIDTHLSSVPPCKLDRNMILTVVRNILSNAIKFSKKGTTIEIKAYQENTNLIIAIKDEGIGMNEKKMKVLLKKKHSSNLGTDGEQGFGLGLTISHAFIRQHKGTLKVESKEGIGSEFKIILPIS